MHADISQYVDIYSSEVTLIDWKLLRNFSDFPRAVLSKRNPENIFNAGLRQAGSSQYVDTLF